MGRCRYVLYLAMCVNMSEYGRVGDSLIAILACIVAHTEHVIRHIVLASQTAIDKPETCFSVVRCMYMYFLAAQMKAQESMVTSVLLSLLNTQN